MQKLRLILKYSAVGGVAALLDIFVLYLLVDINGFYYLNSAIISFTIATVFAFILQKKFTFKDDNPEVSKQISYFFIISTLGMMLYVGFIHLFVTILGLWYLLAAVFSKGLCFVWNFSLNHFITFKIEEA